MKMKSRLPVLFAMILAGSAMAENGAEGKIAGGTAPDRAKIAEVAAGKRAEAHAVWWGKREDDATECLQKAFDSGAKKIIVDNVGSDWIVRPLFIPSDVEVVFRDGVVIRAKKGEFKKVNDSLFTIKDRRNVVLRGEGRVLFEMRKADYMDKKLYRHAEWRHSVSIVNSEHVSVRNLTLRSSGGDGVYVGSKRARDILLEDLVCDDHHRQGISVTGVTGLTVRRCRFLNTRGTPPQCGLDLEPNYPEPGLTGILFEDCEFSGNAFAGICVTDHSAIRIDAEFKNCLISGNKIGLNVGDISSKVPPDGKKGSLRFVGCRFTGNQAGNVHVAHHRPGIALVFRDCSIDNRKCSAPALALSSRSPDDLDGVEIVNLAVTDDEKRAPLVFMSRFGNGLVAPKIENVTVLDSSGKREVFDTRAFAASAAPDPTEKNFTTLPLEIKNLVPVSRKGVPSNGTIRFRNKSEFCVYAKTGDRINIKFSSVAVHKYYGKRYAAPFRIVMSTPTISNMERLAVPFEKTLDYTLNAGETGVYRFSMDARMQTLCVDCDAPGQAVSAAEKLYIFRSAGELFFTVPPGDAKILIEANGVPKEPASVWLIDPAGKVVDSMVKSEGGKVLKGEKKSAGPEIWKLRFKAEKLFLRIGAPLVPLFSTAPENLLAPKAFAPDCVPLIRGAKYSNQEDFVRNGDFSFIEKRKDGASFPKFWKGKADAPALDGKGIILRGAVYSYLQLPNTGGHFTCSIEGSGTGKFTAFLRTAQSGNGKKKMLWKERKPLFGPFELKPEKQTFSFKFDTVRGEEAYLYVSPSGKNSMPVLHRVKIVQN